jgi:hypothetical protein
LLIYFVCHLFLLPLESKLPQNREFDEGCIPNSKSSVWYMCVWGLCLIFVEWRNKWIDSWKYYALKPNMKGYRSPLNNSGSHLIITGIPETNLSLNV